MLNISAKVHETENVHPNPSHSSPLLLDLPRGERGYSDIQVTFCCCDEDTMTNSNWGKKGFFWLAQPSHCLPLMEIRAGT